MSDVLFTVKDRDSKTCIYSNVWEFLNSNNSFWIMPLPKHVCDFKNDINFAVGNLNAERITNLKLSNLLGEIIFQTNYFNKTEIKDHLNIASLNKGVYFLNISNNLVSQIRKFI